MLTSLRIIHPPSSDNPTFLPVLIFSFDDKKFLFNVPEGTTRVLTERGSRGVSKNLKGVFVPRVGYDECGGLFGLLMSLADQSKNGINLYGPPVFSQFLCTARMYAARENFQVKVNECDLSGNKVSSSSKSKTEDGTIIYKDKDVTIEAVPVYPNNFSLPVIADGINSSFVRPVKKQKKDQNGNGQHNPYSASTDIQDVLELMFPHSNSRSNGHISDNASESMMMDDDAELNGKRQKKFSSRFKKMPSPSLSPVKLTDAADGQAPALTYIVKCSSTRGRFNAEKAKEMGVPHPSYYSKITEDLDIEISRPKDWLTWDAEKKKAWFKRQAILVQSKSGKRRTTNKFEDDLGEVETEKVMIYSKDLLAPSMPGTSIIQTYLPSIDYLDSFFSPQTQARFDDLDEQLHCMIHGVHPDILNEKRYQDFIKRFPNTHHYISSRPYIADKLTYSGFALGMLRLSKIDPTLFKVPEYSLTPQKFLSEVGLDVPNVHPVGTETIVQLQPRREPDSECSTVQDMNFPIDSDQAESMASFMDEAKTPSQAVTFSRGRQKWPKFLELVSQLQEEELQNESHNMTLNGQSKSTLNDLAITTLGTGSALPSKHRNVSSALVHLPEGQGYILLDAGESTYGQLSRKFGKGVDDILRNLRLIFLSHAHGDHHMGTAKLLAERKKLNIDRPLFVLSNLFTRLYLQEVNDIQPLDICPESGLEKAERGVIFLDSEDFDSWHGVHSDSLARNPTKEGKEFEMYLKFIESKSRGHISKGNTSSFADAEEFESKVDANVKMVIQGRSRMRDAAKQQYERLQENVFGTGIFTTEVKHRGPKCYGIILRGKGWSLAFSGDTMPCKRFIDAGRGVDILLHEATFENGEEKNASMKRHSTIGQALKVAKKMKAKRILLTHFSQRYPHLPNLALQMVNGSENSSEDADNDGLEPSVGISFDLMTMRANDIGKTERYREAMQLLFDVESHESDDEGGDDGGGVGGDAATGQSNGAGSLGGEGKDNKKAFKERHEDRSSGKEEGKIDTINQAVLSSKPNKSTKTGFIQTKFVKDHEFGYLVVQIVPQRRSSTSTSNSENLAINRLQFDESITKSLEELHGIIGGSFQRDLVFFDRVEDNSILAIIKVATSFAQQLASVIASGIEIKSNSGEQFITRYGGLLNAFDLPSVLSMIGDGATDRSRRTIQPPGRAWMQSILQNSENFSNV